MNAKLGSFLLLMTLLLFTLACGPGQQPGPTLTPSPSHTPVASSTATPILSLTHTPTPSPTSMPTPAVATVLAPIDGARLEYAPEGSVLVVTSGLPDGCHRFKGYEISYVDGVIRVTVWNTTPTGPDVMCTMVYGMVETRIPLSGVAGFGPVTPCQSYAVEANGSRFSVQAVGKTTSCKQSEVSSSLGKEVSLGVGQSAVFAGEGLAVRFLGIPQDSRCPKDVTCVWAGEVKVLVEAVLNGRFLGRHELVLGAGGPSATVTLDGYVVQLLKLEPYPTSAGIAPDAYAATFVINKGAA